MIINAGQLAKPAVQVQSAAVPAQNSEAVVSTAPTAATATPKVSWLKKVGQEIWTGVKDVVGVLASPGVQKAEQTAASVAEALLPADSQLIASFSTIAGKIFQQAVVAETSGAAAAASGASKLSAVMSAVGSDIDQWVANNFPGSAALSAATKAGLINAIVAIQNDITAPTASA